MRRLTLAALGGLAVVLLSGSPAHAWFRHHHMVYGGYGQPVAAPVSPLGFGQILQGIQLVTGIVGDIRGMQQGGQQQQQQQPARCIVSSDVVQSMNRSGDTLDNVVNLVNALAQGDEKTKKFRDPKYPDLNKPLEKAKATSGSGGGSGTKLEGPPPHE